MKIKYFKQETNYTCGAAAMRMVLFSLGIKKTEKQIDKLLKTWKKYGTSLKSFPRLAEKYKLEYEVFRHTNIRELKKALSKKYYVILCYNPFTGKVGHYAIVNKIESGRIYLCDPWFGKNHSYKLSYFKKIWNAPHERQIRWFIGIKK